MGKSKAAAVRSVVDFVAGVLGASSACAFKESATACRAVVRADGASSALALGVVEGCGSPGEASEVAQWLNFGSLTKSAKARDLDDEMMSALDGHLLTRSFLVSDRLSLADVAVFHAVHASIATRTNLAASKWGNVCRWYDQLQKSAPIVASSVAPPLIHFDYDAAASDCDPPSQEKNSVGKASNDKKANKKSSDKKQKKKKEKKKRAPKPAAPEQPLITALDIRVGKILKAWEHESADSLYCEEIDVGEEGGPRSICSGLRKFYSSADQISGKMCLVLCNLKKRNMVGFPSHGMVLCASSEGKASVELVEPPADAKIGERVVFEGINDGKDQTYEPFAPNKIAKKKVFEALAPLLKTTAEGNAAFVDETGKVFSFLTSAGKCAPATIKNGSVS